MPPVVKFSEAVSIALHSMVLMAVGSEDLTSVREIADAFGFSRAHVAKVLQRLAKSGLVSSTRGPTGGFKLTRSPDKVGLLQIYEAIEGPFEDQTCLLDGEICPGSACLLGDTIREVNQQVRAALSDKKLSQLARSFMMRRTRPLLERH